MAKYIPFEHRQFIYWMRDERLNMVQCINILKQNKFDENDISEITELYNLCLSDFKRFRATHIQIATDMIVIPASKLQQKTKGTGGSTVIPYLKSVKDRIGSFKEKEYIFNKKYKLRLQQFDANIHFPTIVGCSQGQLLCKICDENIIKPDKIKTICDVGCGLGHFTFLCDKLFTNSTEIVAIDILQSSLDHTLNNWRINNCKNEKKLKLIQSDVANYFKNKNKQKFDFIISNPPNLGSDELDSDILNDPFHIGNTGRYMLDTILLDGYKALNVGGYLFVTDTTLNYVNKTNDILNKKLKLRENKDWRVIKQVIMDFPFFNRYKTKIKPEWIEKLIKEKRLFMENGKYIQKRRYILIQKPIRYNDSTIPSKL